ncbi:MAG TPA: hypothetical protein VKA53_08070, partial [Thermoanaerobaculia bacterium]|nr:hypothetical protein [Thermoanaerobaculia bacterium]
LLLCATFLLFAGNTAIAATDASAGNHGQAMGISGNPCSFLDARTVSGITGLHITKVQNLGDSCLYVDSTAPVSLIVQQFGQALSMAFSGESPFRLKGAPEGGMPKAQSGAGVIVRSPSGEGTDLTKVNVHDYAAEALAEVPADAGCGQLQDVTGLNAVSIVCYDGAIGHSGVAKNGKLVYVMFLAPGKTATNKVMGRLVRAAAAHM